MKKAKEIFCRFMKEEEGTTAVEYAVMVGLISAAIIGAVGALSSTISGTLQGISGVIEANSTLF